MNISNKGLIEIMSHEGVCLSPYLDSVGTWTIGVGITKFDGVDPKTMGTITIDQAIAMFRSRIGAYVAPVEKLGLTLSQAQFDALVSFCYNVGPGNLASLCHNRTIPQIGAAFDLYHKPPEITARRNKEKKLFQAGVYSSNGKVLVFPVNAEHKPVYGAGYEMDVSKYFTTSAPATPVAPPAAKPSAPSAPKPPVVAAPTAPPAQPSLANTITLIVNAIIGLFKH